MILVVMGFPQAAISIAVVNDENSTDAIFRQTVWYDDFAPVVRECAKNYDIERVVMFGPTDYLKGLANFIENIVDNIEIVVGD